MEIKKITYPGIRPNMYTVTDSGIVANAITGKIMATRFDHHGYLIVSLCVTNPTGKAVAKNFKVHRLVAWEFVPNPDPENFTVVNHIDGKIIHNDSYNLEWCDQKHNLRHAAMLGNIKYNGARNSNAKFTEAFVRSVCERYEKGEMPIDIYRDMHPGYPTHHPKYTSDYTLLRYIKQRKNWTEVSKDYNFDTEIKRTTQNITHPAKAKNSIWDENDVRWICSRLVRGWTAGEIISFIRSNDSHRYDNMRNMTDAYLRASISKIRRGKMWIGISKDYEFTSKETRDFEEVDFANMFKRLEYRGFSKAKIIQMAANESRIARAVIETYYRNYKTLEKMTDESYIVIESSDRNPDNDLEMVC